MAVQVWYVVGARKCLLLSLVLSGHRFLLRRVSTVVRWMSSKCPLPLPRGLGDGRSGPATRMALPLQPSHSRSHRAGLLPPVWAVCFLLWAASESGRAQLGCLVSVCTTYRAGRAAFLLKLQWPLEWDTWISHLLPPGLAPSPPGPWINWSVWGFLHSACQGLAMLGMTYCKPCVYFLSEPN